MTESQITDQAPTAVSVLDVPEFSGEPYVVLNGNEPGFTDEEKTTESYEHYSDLDSLGRCGVAEANIGQDLMPTARLDRGSQADGLAYGKIRSGGR